MALMCVWTTILVAHHVGGNLNVNNEQNIPFGIPILIKYKKVFNALWNQRPTFVIDTWRSN